MAPDRLAPGFPGYQQPPHTPLQQQHPQHQPNQPHQLQAAPPPSAAAATAESAAAAAAAADDSKVKRARTSRPKVKTGCNNCKQRRIKCDETRPACTQCIRAKRACSGYPPPARSSRPYEEVRIAPKPLLAPALAGAAGAAAAAGQPAPLAPRPLRPLQMQVQQASLLPQQQSAKLLPRRQPPHNRQQQLQVAPRRMQKMQQRQNKLPFTYNPSITLPLSQQDGMYFQLFRLHTANELSGFFDDVFWSRTVLVECHSAAAIRHAVVALGALYKTLETTTESPPSSPNAAAVTPFNAADNAANHWEVALRQYSGACHALATMNPENPHIQRTRLIASVLLACFDSFIGDHRQAIVQIQTGLALLERLRAGRNNSQTQLKTTPPDGSYVPQHIAAAAAATTAEPVEDELLQMFTRLAIQAKSYDMAFHFPQPYVIRLLPSGASTVSELASSDASGSLPSSPAASSDVGSPSSMQQDPIPEHFSSLREARLAWDTLCERMLRFTETMFQFANGPPNILPRHMKRYGQQFQARLEAWNEAFEPLLAGRTRPDVSSQEKAGIAVLKMFQIMGFILFFMTFSDSEMQFDAFKPQFTAIVNLAVEIVGDEERRAAAARCPDPNRCVHQRQREHQQHHQRYTQQYEGTGYRARHVKASFSADLGIVPPLYVVATKSRDRVLRRQAIQLLRSSARREGMWDSELMARIGMWVMDIEEEGDDLEDSLREPTATMSSRQSSTGMSAGMPLTPGDSPVPSVVTLPQRHRSPGSGASGQGVAAGAGLDFGGAPLGPGGNARWDARRESSASSVRSSSTLGGAGPSTQNQGPPHYSYVQQPIPAEKRVLVKACEFDLREHVAILKCGTRGLVAGTVDQKTRETQIRW